MERAHLAELLAPWRSRLAADEPAARRYLAEPVPEEFMARFAAAVADTGEVFLGNPAWGDAEQAQVDGLLSATAPEIAKSGWLMIPTGGTSGGVRFARHDSVTIAAAVGGFARHFSAGRVNAVGVLPLHHVSGLMAWLRCALTGGSYLHADWRALAEGRLPRLPATDDGWMLSLVPTQLDRLLREKQATDWLRQFRIVFLGGGPPWDALLDRAAAARLPLSPGYGMTETAAMVAGLRPDQFLAGARGCGTALPHARITIDPEGVITVAGESVFRGYFPARDGRRDFATGDLGRFDDAGRLHIVGRRDGAIITGGEKVHPEEVEAVLRETGEFSDLVVLGIPDAEWGQRVVVAYPAGRAPDSARVAAALSRDLAAFKHPKAYVPVGPWPVSAAGKARRSEIARRIGDGAGSPGG